MKNAIPRILFPAVLFAATAVAQPFGLNLGRARTIEGTITSVQIGFGAQYPSIVVDRTPIKVAPIWFLLDNDFELAVGDAVSVKAAGGLRQGDGYFYAIEITKTSSGATIRLRSDTGTPLWMGPEADRPKGVRTGGYCIDAGSVRSASGIIESVNAGVGVQFPTLTLKLEDGALLTVKLGPERLLLANDFELNPGSSLTVEYALATCTDSFVALKLSNPEGRTLVLRNPNGTPAW